MISSVKEWVTYFVVPNSAPNLQYILITGRAAVRWESNDGSQTSTRLFNSAGPRQVQLYFCFFKKFWHMDVGRGRGRGTFQYSRFLTLHMCISNFKLIFNLKPMTREAQIVSNIAFLVRIILKVIYILIVYDFKTVNHL